MLDFIYFILFIEQNIYGHMCHYYTAHGSLFTRDKLSLREIDFRRQILTSKVDSRTEGKKLIIIKYL